MADNTRYMDTRTVDRYVKQGLISKQDFEKHLKSLPDLEPEANWVHMDLHDTELGEDSDGAGTPESL